MISKASLYIFRADQGIYIYISYLSEPLNVITFKFMACFIDHEDTLLNIPESKYL